MWFNKQGVSWAACLVVCTQWSNCKIRARGTLSLSFLPSPFLFPYPSLPSLRSRPLKFSYWVWGVLWAPPVGSGAGPQSTKDSMHFSLNIWHLVATILIFFLRIKWPNFVHFMITNHFNEPKKVTLNYSFIECMIYSYPRIHPQRSCKLGERRSPA